MEVISAVKWLLSSYKVTIMDDSLDCQGETGLIRLHIDNETVEKPASSEADGKCPDARPPKSRGMRRTWKYAAVIYPVS